MTSKMLGRCGLGPSLSKALGLGDLHPETFEAAAFPSHPNDLDTVPLRCGYCAPLKDSDPGKGH